LPITCSRLQVISDDKLININPKVVIYS